MVKTDFENNVKVYLVVISEPIINNKKIYMRGFYKGLPKLIKNLELLTFFLLPNVLHLM